MGTFGALMGQIIEKLEPTGIFSEEDYVIEMDEDSSSVMLDMNSLENEAARLLIPFLRTASLVKHYIYKLDLPEISEDDEEFDQLVKFLDLIVQDLDQVGEQEEPMDQAISGRVNLIDVVQWFSDSGEELQMWCAEFADLACRDHIHLARQAMRVNVLWKQPQLLRLHQQFDQIFQFYHKKVCDQCGKVPKDPAVCLMCGTMVCMRENCCRKNIIGNQVNKDAACETVRHSIECGGGTGIFLSVNSSTIIVVRGKRACVWGSVFLDFFGEEDKELKRGQPLYLNEKRYQLLEHQWVSHKFDHTNKRWVPHRNSI